MSKTKRLFIMGALMLSMMTASASAALAGSGDMNLPKTYEGYKRFIVSHTPYKGDNACEEAKQYAYNLYDAYFVPPVIFDGITTEQKIEVLKAVRSRVAYICNIK